MPRVCCPGRPFIPHRAPPVESLNKKCFNSIKQDTLPTDRAESSPWLSRNSQQRMLQICVKFKWRQASEEQRRRGDLDGCGCLFQHRKNEETGKEKYGSIPGRWKEFHFMSVCPLKSIQEQQELHGEPPTDWLLSSGLQTCLCFAFRKLAKGKQKQ